MLEDGLVSHKAVGLFGRVKDNQELKLSPSRKMYLKVSTFSK